MAIRKFFETDVEPASFTWLIKDNSYNSRSTGKFYGHTGDLIVTIVGVKNGVTLYDITEVSSNDIEPNLSATIPTDVCDVISFTITLTEPQTVTQFRVQGSFVNYSQLKLETTQGFAKLINCTIYDAYYYQTYIPLSEELLLVQSLQKIDCKTFDNIKNLDARIQGLPNLEILTIGFKEPEIIDTSFLLDCPALETFGQSVPLQPMGNNIAVNDARINFPISFSSFTQLKEVILEEGDFINLPDSLKNLSIETIKTVGVYHDLTVSSDYVFPLLANANNTILKTISVLGRNQPTAKPLVFSNIERLTALQSIVLNIVFGTGDQAKIDQIESFYEMFYSKIYNETDNLKDGYTVSQTSISSGYFSTITPVAGFNHPTFRTISFSDNGNSVKNDVAVSDKIIEMRNAGMTMTGNQLI